MTLLITTATSKEMRAVLTGFNGRGRVGCVMPAEGVPSSSPVNGYDCLLLITGIAPINAAFHLGRTLATYPRIKAVLNFGIAGSFDLEKAPLGSSVLVEHEIWPEFGLATEQGISAEALRFPLHEDAGQAQATVWNTIALNPIEQLNALELRKPKRCLYGDSLTVSGVSGYPERAEALHHHGALIENMEGFALALGCIKAGVSFLECRTISNKVGSRSAVDWALDDALTALGSTARAFFC